jgi:type IV pilus assembly protein PilY1
MTSSCQPNHLVLLTDGQANGNTSSARSSIASLAGSCNYGWDDGEICARELTKFIYENDLSSTLDSKQNIKVHTIGFALDASYNAADIKQFLIDLASPKTTDSATPTSFYAAADASSLKSAFESISQEVMSVDTTFVAPGATVNQFSRKSYKNELYFSLFRPKATDLWPGNLKRYGITSAGIVDADGLVAVKADSTFLDSARSYWSSTADGNNTQAGGAASNLPDFASRKMLTYIGDSVPAGGTALDALDTTLLSNSTIASRVGGTTQLATRLAANFNESDADEQLKLINWIRGSADGSSNSVASNQRKGMGDPLHSEPVLATFACTAYSDSTYTNCTAEDQSVFIGSNEGLVQSINTVDGSEDFSFMPEELMVNIEHLKNNLESTSGKPRPYGIDNTVALWVNDVNNNGVIYGGKDTSSSTPSLLSGLNPDEFVYAYATMRRGGRSIYALNVTDRSNPKLLWQITGGVTPGFAQLGQTWSVPVKTKIQVGSTIKDVLLFSGGYNETQDDKTSYSPDSVGNALYIVDASTGALIWSTTSTGSPTLTLSKMIYSMPASPRAIDLDGDGLADQFFIGDMGGQVWRFFINNGSTGSALVSPTDSDGNATLSSVDGVFASIGGLGAANFRRLYNSPDIALTKHNGQLQLAVSIGSGYRAHPLNLEAEDRFYSFRSSQVYGSASAVAHTTLTESSLYDATSNVLQTGTDSSKTTALAQLNASKGWMVKLSLPGEKVLSESLTYLGGVYFTTYAPGDADANICKSVAGTSRFYGLDLSDATAYGWANSSSTLSRYRTLATVGIPPRPIIVHLDGGPSKVCIGTDCTDVEAISFDPIPTYWIDK